RYTNPYLADIRSTCPLGSASTSSVLPMIGQPSSPGMWVSELRFGGVRVIAGEATLCIDMAVAPLIPDHHGSHLVAIAASTLANNPVRVRCKFSSRLRWRCRLAAANAG